MRFGGHSHTFLISVVPQGSINLGKAETPVHFGAVEAIAIFGENNALYLISLPSVAEIHFHTLPFQVGDKHIPVPMRKASATIIVKLNTSAL